MSELSFVPRSGLLDNQRLDVRTRKVNYRFDGLRSFVEILVKVININFLRVTGEKERKEMLHVNCN